MKFYMVLYHFDFCGAAPTKRALCADGYSFVSVFSAPLTSAFTRKRVWGSSRAGCPWLSFHLGSSRARYGRNRAAWRWEPIGIGRD